MDKNIDAATITTCSHESFNGGYQRRCEGCGHTRDYILGFDAGYAAASPAWVRCDLRLPDNTGPWIVSFPGIGDEILVDCDFYDSHRGWRRYQNVIAWTPLPQSYKAEPGGGE